MKIALLISTYNWTEALDLAFESLRNQTLLPDELLIADDGSTNETKELIDRFRKESSIPIKHVWHEDKGFRRSAILNKTIAQSDSDYIIQIDGDCIPDKYFIADHVSNISSGMYLYGSRVNIVQQYAREVLKKRMIRFGFLSKEIENRTRVLRIKLLADLYKPSDRISSKVRGCNLSFWRKDFIAINGYNEDMEGWGREDSEMALRLHNNNIRGKRLRYRGVVFHLFHKENSKSNFAMNDEIQQQTISNRIVKCNNGIDKYL